MPFSAYVFNNKNILVIEYIIIHLNLNDIQSFSGSIVMGIDMPGSQDTGLFSEIRMKILSCISSSFSS